MYIMLEFELLFKFKFLISHLKEQVQRTGIYVIKSTQVPWDGEHKARLEADLDSYLLFQEEKKNSSE